MLKSDAIKLCQENNFNAGFFEGSDNNGVVDAYELKVIFAFHSVCVSPFLLSSFNHHCIYK